MKIFIKERTKVYLKSVRPECFLSSKNVSKDVEKNRSKKLMYMNNPSIHSLVLRFSEHSGRTGRGIIYFFGLMVLSMPLLTHPFSYDSAIYAAQKGDIQSADEQMRTIVVNSPDSPDVLYDAGVLAYELKNFDQASAYFARAAECARDNKDICFRAYFNAGNASVDTKNLKEALGYYDKALAIEPDNEYARHNRDRVAQMLQQQEQKKDDQQDQQQNSEQNDQDEQEKDQQNQQEQDDNQGNKQQNDSQQQQGDQQQKQNDHSSDGSDQKSQGDQRKNSTQSDDREQGKQQGNKEKNHQKPTNENKQRNGEQDLDEKSERADDKGKQQQGKQHKKSPEKENKAGDKNSIASQDKQEQGSSSADVSSDVSDKALAKSEARAKEDTIIDDPWLLNILNEQELQDKAMNKKLMEAKVRQHGGKNDQNNW